MFFFHIFKHTSFSKPRFIKITIGKVCQCPIDRNLIRVKKLAQVPNHLASLSPIGMYVNDFRTQPFSLLGSPHDGHWSKSKCLSRNMTQSLMHTSYFERGISKCFIIRLASWNDPGNWFGLGSVALWLCKTSETAPLDIPWFTAKHTNVQSLPPKWWFRILQTEVIEA